MASKSFTMRISDEDRETFTQQAEREGRTRTGQFIWLLRRREKELDKEEKDRGY